MVFGPNAVTQKTKAVHAHGKLQSGLFFKNYLIFPSIVLLLSNCHSDRWSHQGLSTCKINSVTVILVEQVSEKDLDFSLIFCFLLFPCCHKIHGRLVYKFMQHEETGFSN